MPKAEYFRAAKSEKLRRVNSGQLRSVDAGDLRDHDAPGAEKLCESPGDLGCPEQDASK